MKHYWVVAVIIAFGLIISAQTLAVPKNTYEIYETKLGVFLLDKEMGVTWRYGRNVDENGNLKNEGWGNVPVF